MPPAVKIAKILRPAVKNSPNFASGSLKINKILPLGLKNGRNFAPAVKNGLISLKNVAEGALPGKVHQDPPNAKAAPGKLQ